jgi:hypothetical protein
MVSGCFCDYCRCGAVQAAGVEFRNGEETIGPGPGRNAGIASDNGHQGSRISSRSGSAGRDGAADAGAGCSVEPIGKAALGNTEGLYGKGSKDGLAHRLSSDIGGDYID